MIRPRRAPGAPRAGGTAVPVLAWLMVVAGGLLAAASLVGPAWHGLRESAARQAARDDIRVLVRGIEAFAREEGRLPHPPVGGHRSRIWGDAFDNREVIRFLAAPREDAPPLLSAPMAAPRQSGLSPDGDFLDPWGRQYRIAFDLTGDEFLDLGGTRGRRPGTLAVWSVGPDGVDGTADDLTSWSL